MMGTFEEMYARLNTGQRRAVDALDGPVLVIAGPGTGKTQLLTARIANILARTDATAANILCLTFTESGAEAMRERLVSFIGQAAYDVTISTYHAFGSDLIRRLPDYFVELADTRPVDDLGADGIFREIISKLPYGNPLKFADNYVGDVRALVSDARRALLTPDDVRRIAGQNLDFIAAATKIVKEQLAHVTRVDKKSIAAFESLSRTIDRQVLKPTAPSRATAKPLSSPGRSAARRTDPEGEPAASTISTVQELRQLFVQTLREALTQVQASGKTTALTAWKNTWLAKDETGGFIVDGERTNRKLRALADIYEAYLRELEKRKLFDYDDMILRAVHALETHADLRFTLQERYLYILLDEFQDTNGAQLRLVELLTDNPVNEGRPNVLAVGDDDQAIYAFQGANYSHMLQFQRMYQDVLVVPLTENYRSHRDILHVARGVAEQIEERLHHHFPAIEKTLSAASESLPARAIVERREAKSDVGQLAWVAAHIRALLDSGQAASEIAVLAPQHKYLEPLVPFLQQQGVPLRYEKREDVLDDPAITQLLRMSELCVALGGSDRRAADSLWPEVLSFPFWHVPTSLIWELSWKANDSHDDWTTTLLNRAELKPIALFFVRLGLLANNTTVETMLDYLIGTQRLDLQEPGMESFVSPFYEFYFAELALVPDPTSGQALTAKNVDEAQAKVSGRQARRARVHAETVSADGGSTASKETARGGDFWSLLTNLIVLRARLREYKSDEPEPLRLADFVEFARAHRAAGIKILNTSPYQEAAEAVQLLTAFKAKGQEYAAVFVLAVNDEAWGASAQTKGSHISVPPNLHFIRYAGASNDERLRLFYVAITRAKSQLYLANYTSSYAGKVLSRLKYLNESVDGQGTIRSPLLPENAQSVLAIGDETAAPSVELAAYWQRRHEAAVSSPELAQLLRGRLARFQLSATHLGDFIDLIHCGPEAFFTKNILRFPQAPRPEVAFGNAMHETLEWLQGYCKRSGQAPTAAVVFKTFEQRLRAKRLDDQATGLLLARGRSSLEAYAAQRMDSFLENGRAEYNFRSEGVFVGEAHLAGKIDRLVIDPVRKTIAIVDYKTGRAYSRWAHDAKLHKYEQQLYFYKTLVEGARSFAGYTVTDAYLEFVEPDEQGRIIQLHAQFDPAKMRALKTLIAAVWQRIKTLQLPDTTMYTADLRGILAFERDLVASIDTSRPPAQTANQANKSDSGAASLGTAK